MVHPGLIKNSRISRLQRLQKLTNPYLGRCPRLSYFAPLALRAAHISRLWRCVTRCMNLAYWTGLPLERGDLCSSSHVAAFMAASSLSLTRRLRSSAIFAGERSNWTGDCSIRLTIVPSENPASISSTMESLVSVATFSSFTGAPASLGGRIIRTVALPVVNVSPDDEVFPPRLLVPPRLPPLEPKMSVLLPESPGGFPAIGDSFLSIPESKKASSFQRLPMSSPC